MMARQIDDRTWVKNHFSRLEEIAIKGAEDGSGLFEGVGPWTALKQITIHNILGMYLTIMAKQPWAKTLTFIDTNASCGVNRIREKEFIMAGSSLIAAAARTSFHRYIFIEKDREKCQVLRERLERFIPPEKFDVLEGTADERLPEVMEEVPAKDAHYFAVVDPYTLNISWEGIKSLLSHPRGDVLVNFQTTHFKRGSPDTAVAFCGTEKVRELIEEQAPENEFLQMFQERLAPLRPVQETIRIKSGESRYYYDFIYATAQTRGENPWMKAIGPIKRRVERLSGRYVMSILENKGVLDQYQQE